MKNGLYFNGQITNMKKYINLLNELKENKKKYIACDIDNTIVNVNKILKAMGYDISKYPVEGITKNFWIGKEGINILLRAEPIIPMFKVLKTLENCGGNIVFVTKRHKDLAQITSKWFELNKIKSDIEVFYITNNKIGIDADIYIEDDPHEINILRQYKKDIIVPEWSYNKGFDDLIYVKFNEQEQQNIGGMKHVC